MHLKVATEEIYQEAKEAMAKFPRLNSCHEGLAVIEEEFEELKAEVFKNSVSRDVCRLREEARQLGAMAVRFMTALT